MKTIELKTIKDDGAGDFDYRKNLLSIARAPLGNQGGVNVAEMRLALKVLDKLEAAEPGSNVELEDTEHEFLNARVAAWPWARAHRVLLEFAEAVEKAPSKSDVARTEGEKAEA